MLQKHFVTHLLLLIQMLLASSVPGLVLKATRLLLRKLGAEGSFKSICFRHVAEPGISISPSPPLLKCFHTWVLQGWETRVVVCNVVCRCGWTGKVKFKVVRNSFCCATVTLTAHYVVVWNNHRGGDRRTLWGWLFPTCFTKITFI